MIAVWPLSVHSIAAVRPPKPAPTMITRIPVLGYCAIGDAIVSDVMRFFLNV